MPNNPALVLDVSFPKSQTRLRDQARQARWSCDQHAHFLPYMEYLGGIMHIYSPRIKINLQVMESHGNFQPHLQQKWLVREFNSCGLEYFWAHISEQFMGGLNRSMCHINGINCKEVK